MRKIVRLLTIVAAVSVAAALSIGSTAWASETALIDLNSGSDGPNHHDSVCAAVIGVSQNFNEITYVVEAEGAASSSAKVPAVGVGTTVRCSVVDITTGTVYGEVNGGLPGPAAVAAGTVTVPTGVHVVARVCGAAVFSDGGSIDTCKD